MIDLQTKETIKKALRQVKDIIDNPNRAYILKKVVYPDEIRYLKVEVK
jgi:hypothetical protein